jgi:hypothetical protein
VSEIGEEFLGRLWINYLDAFNTPGIENTNSIKPKEVQKIQAQSLSNKIVGPTGSGPKAVDFSTSAFILQQVPKSGPRLCIFDPVDYESRTSNFKHQFCQNFSDSLLSK